MRLEKASGSKVKDNKIGTDVNGLVKIPNGKAGVAIDESPNNTVRDNLISGNTLVGVFIVQAASIGNKVLGNKIGTTRDGDKALENGYHGVLIHNAPNNQIGGSTAADRNVISGNKKDGVRIEGKDSKNNTVAGNYIGVDVLGGTTKVPNGRSGIWIDKAPENIVGGIWPESGNVISGNGSDGVVINGADAKGNKILGNLIGTDKNGLGTAMGNLGIGVFVQGAVETRIGGTTTRPGSAPPEAISAPHPPGNVISGNGSDGILINGDDNYVEGNLIGLNRNYKKLANRSSGVVILDAKRNIIGDELGTPRGATKVWSGNVISGNREHGVEVVRIASTSVHNTIRINSIFDNDGLGIDLMGGEGVRQKNIAKKKDDVTPNDHEDADTGPNNLMNFPVGVTAWYDAGKTYISGTLDTSSPENTVVDVYINSKIDPSGFGEGEIYVGRATPNKDGVFHLEVIGRLAHPYLIAVATDKTGSTSEFSPVYDIDSDGDGLPDDWETNGIDFDGDGRCDLIFPAWAPSPTTKTFSLIDT